ncbi:aldolase [Herbidospora galbida]|uniref:Aldolase n=1 Tax=Herbidospora galbida TaxID=2575442 RepID=A0A4U3M812_9ACTN|nr:aldolase [Herbidospora galbida]TKK85001.1 aldolase [Herbidospora galbida]
MEINVAGFDNVHRTQQARFPVREIAWQPVHTVYVPANLLTASTVSDWGAEAAGLLGLTTPAEFAGLFGGDVHDRVARTLAREPIQDLRIDFEDGYTGADEDADMIRAAEAVAAMPVLPRRWGLRVKSFADGDPGRSLRTLRGFLERVVELKGGLPDGFVITFPKVLMESYLGMFARSLAELEHDLNLPTLGFEMQVEAPQTILFLQRSPDLVANLRGRLKAAHFGVFDYTAACGLPPHEQRLDHPACDHARHVMQTVLHPEGVELSDGSLAAAPASASKADVLALWRRHAETVRHSLAHGYYQGWDMHPSHLVSRFAVVYAHHLATYDAYRARVEAWQASRQEGGVLDEPATIKTLVAALRRADLALGLDSRSTGNL